MHLIFKAQERGVQSNHSNKQKNGLATYLVTFKALLEINRPLVIPEVGSIATQALSGRIGWIQRH